ncbi:hypothetical protein Dimus_024657 [Dionaea muscipula]
MASTCHGPPSMLSRPSATRNSPSRRSDIPPPPPPSTEAPTSSSFSPTSSARTSPAQMISSSRTYVKKKAIAVALRVLSQYPDAVKVCFRRLVENLESSDPQALSAAVGVFCELTLRDPKAYLPLAPEFYRVLIDCKNNWILIKVLKIFSKLPSLEPRLANKVVDPICEIMRRTMAKSLMFECVKTVVSSLNEYESAVKLAVGKIREFLVDDDPNLKYLGLEALSALSVNHLWALMENKDVVIKWLSDLDPSIKLASLRLVMLMVSEDNVIEISRVLIHYALKSDPGFCNEILGSILATCSRNYYEVVFDFDWYVCLLGEMSRIPHCQRGEEIESQLTDISMRVKDVRHELVHVARDLLIDPALLGNPFLHRILSAAAWVSGEYVEDSKNLPELLEALLQPRTGLLPPSIQAVYIHSAFKVLVYCLHSYLSGHEATSTSLTDVDVPPILGDSECQYPESFSLATHITLATSVVDREFDSRECNQQYEDEKQGQSFSEARKNLTRESIVNLLHLTEVALGPLSGSIEDEVRERAQNVLGLVDLVKLEIAGDSIQQTRSTQNIDSETIKVVKHIYNSFSEDLGPVSASAQGRVTVPDGLLLEENLDALEIIYGNNKIAVSSSFSLGIRHSREEALSLDDVQSKEDIELSTESTSLLAEHRKIHGLYYLPLEKHDALTNEYPPATEGNSFSIQKDGANALVKLTDQSLVIMKKRNHAKLRPVVVKLDEAEEVGCTLNEPESKDDLISDAVREALLSSEGVPGTTLDDISSSKRKGKEKLWVDHPNSRSSSANSDLAKLEIPHSRSKHGSHLGKEGKSRSHKKNEKRGEANHSKEKKQNKHHLHSGQKGLQVKDTQPNTVVNTPVIPDFLL